MTSAPVSWILRSLHRREAHVLGKRKYCPTTEGSRFISWLMFAFSMSCPSITTCCKFTKSMIEKGCKVNACAHKIMKNKDQNTAQRKRKNKIYLTKNHRVTAPWNFSFSSSPLHRFVILKPRQGCWVHSLALTSMFAAASWGCTPITSKKTKRAKPSASDGQNSSLWALKAGNVASVRNASIPGKNCKRPWS